MSWDTDSEFEARRITGVTEGEEGWSLDMDGLGLLCLTSEGLVVQCKKHGLVGEFTPTSLAILLEHPPECECCKGQRGQA